jgi:hypothetical protein
MVAGRQDGREPANLVVVDQQKYLSLISPSLRETDPLAAPRHASELRAGPRKG